MSQFVIRFQCDIVDVKTGEGGPATFGITVDARDRVSAMEIVARNLTAAMLIAQRALKEGT